MEKLNEERKEYDIYFKGPFWIVADSVKDIINGNFKIEGLRIPCDYNGDAIPGVTDVKDRPHKKLWNSTFNKDYPDKTYTYFPCGRVQIFEGNGIAYLFLHSKMNMPRVINAIVKYYGIEKLDLEIIYNDLDDAQLDHYQYELK